MADQGGIDPVRKAARGWALAGLALSIPALILAMLSSGAGHGDYAFARALFPVPMLLTFNDTINILSLITALVQFPLYGWIAGRAMARQDFRLLGVVLTLHGLAVAACFSGVLPNFS